MKKILLLSVIQLVFATLYGLSDCDCRIDKLEKQIEQLRIVTPNETCGANTALARPILDVECGCCGANFFVEASILYWHPKMSGTEFASGPLFIEDSEDPGGREILIATMKGCLKSIDFCWNWGFKAGLGYNLPYDGWDLFLTYTGFNSKGCNSVCAEKENEYLVNYKAFPLIEVQANTPLANILSKKAKSKFCINLDALEFDLGRSFYVSESVVLHPKMGLKVFWISFRQNTRYISARPLFQILEDEDRPPFYYSMKDCNDFSGAGPHFAFGTEWHFCGNFYLYGNVSASLLYGLFKIHHKDKVTIIEDVETENVIAQFRNRICQLRHAFVPAVDTQIGLAYNAYCNCDTMHLTLRLAFDAQYIWRINQILETRDITLNYGRISEDLSIHGVTFDIRFDF